jgi:succinate dehydrogenase / fumarate reductase membrane anchor subunit
MTQDSDSLRTPARRVRHLGSARSGTGHMWQMRATSAALIPLSIAFVILIVSLVGKDYATVRATLGGPFAAVLTLLFLIASVHHMALGMRTIIEDYVHGERVRELALIGNLLVCGALGLACVYAVLRISFS